MHDLALNIPGLDGQTQNIPNSPGFRFANDPSHQTIGYLISEGLNVVLYIAFFLVFILLVIGIFRYIFSQGNKDALAKARARVTYALIGFFLVILSIAITQYVKQVLPIQDVKIKRLTPSVAPVAP